MSKPTILEVNVLTGKEVVRDLTAVEIAEIKSLKTAQDELQKSQITARSSALAKLAGLGLTADEIASL